MQNVENNSYYSSQYYHYSQYTTVLASTPHQLRNWGFCWTKGLLLFHLLAVSVLHTGFPHLGLFQRPKLFSGHFCDPFKFREKPQLLITKEREKSNTNVNKVHNLAKRTSTLYTDTLQPLPPCLYIVLTANVSLVCDHHSSTFQDHVVKFSGFSRTTEIFQDSPWSWNLSEKVFLLRTVSSYEIYFFITNFL